MWQSMAQEAGIVGVQHMEHVFSGTIAMLGSMVHSARLR